MAVYWHDRWRLRCRLPHRRFQPLATLANRFSWVPRQAVWADRNGVGCLPRNTTVEIWIGQLNERSNLADSVCDCPNTRQTILSRLRLIQPYAANALGLNDAIASSI